MGFSRQEHWSGLPLPSPNIYLHMAIYPDHSLMFKNAYNLQTLVHKLYMLLLLLSRFSRVRLCVTPQTVAYQAPLSLGFSRQEYCNGFPFPPPMHESEK